MSSNRYSCIVLCSYIKKCIVQGRGEGGPPPSEKGGPGLRGAGGAPEVKEEKKEKRKRKKRKEKKKKEEETMKS